MSPTAVLIATLLVIARRVRRFLGRGTSPRGAKARRLARFISASAW